MGFYFKIASGIPRRPSAKLPQRIPTRRDANRIHGLPWPFKQLSRFLGFQAHGKARFGRLPLRASNVGKHSLVGRADLGLSRDQ